MKMTSQLVTLMIAVFVCLLAVVYAQNDTVTNATSVPVPMTEPPASPSSARPPVQTSLPAADGSSTAASGGGEVTYAPDGNDSDDDDMEGDNDKSGHKGDDDDEEGGGGLSDGEIALAVLATLLIVGTLGTFFGLCYWKYRGTSYVTVTADTTYKQ